MYFIWNSILIYKNIYFAFEFNETWNKTSLENVNLKSPITWEEVIIEEGTFSKGFVLTLNNLSLIFI